MNKIGNKIEDIDYNLTLNYNLKSFIIYFSITFVISLSVIYYMFKLFGPLEDSEDNTNLSFVLALIYGIIISLAKYVQHLNLKEMLAFNQKLDKIKEEFKDCFNLNKLSELYNSLIYDIYPKYYQRQYYIKIRSLADRITERIKCIQLHPELNETK